MSGEKLLLEIVWTMPYGREGVDNGPLNPLKRALSPIFLNGQPFQRLVLCFFHEQSLPNSDAYRWFGAFVLSAGHRVIFFPGNNIPSDPKNYTLAMARGNGIMSNEAYCFDHVTLERDWSSFHVTDYKGRNQRGGPRTLNLGDGRRLWFGMSVKSIDWLRVAGTKTVVSGLVPASDYERRRDAILSSRDGAQFPIMRLHEQADKTFEEGFYHFAVIVGPIGFQDYLGRDLALPFDAPFYAGTKRDFMNIPMRSHRFSIGETLDLQIVSSWLPGKISTPLGFVSQAEPR